MDGQAKYPTYNNGRSHVEGGVYSPSSQWEPVEKKQQQDDYRLGRLLDTKQASKIVVITFLVIILIAATALITLFVSKKDDDNDTTVPVVTLRIPGTATLPGTFTSDLLNPDSKAFKEIEKNFCKEIDELMGSSNLMYQGCDVTEMRSGSIVLIYNFLFGVTEDKDAASIHSAVTDIIETNRASVTAVVELGPLDSIGVALDSASCSSSPCVNNATCYDLIGSYGCRCVRGFYGKNCENRAAPCEDVSLCRGDPCKNGATCFEGVGSFYCQCAPGFNGNNCFQQNASLCQTDSCDNGGTYYCQCTPGYEGENCDMAVDCGDPQPNTNANLITDNPVYNFPSSLEYTCSDPSLTLCGDRRIICQSDRTWSGLVPTCKSVPSPAPDPWCSQPEGWTGPDPIIYFSFELDAHLSLTGEAEFTPEGRIGRGLYGSDNPSQVEYDTSLVDECLYNNTSGCARTVAFWFQESRYLSIPFTTTIGTFTVYSGINVIVFPSSGIRVVVSFGSVNYDIDYVPFIVGEWNHLALAYQLTGETLDLALYVNFEKSLTPPGNVTLNRETVPEKHMVSGTRQYSFGSLDELLVFPGFLSDSQIAQLNQTYQGM